MKALNPDQHTRAWLRNRLFSLVKSQMKDQQRKQALNWLEEANRVLTIADLPENNDKVYFSPGEACLQAILQLLESAEHTLRICVFTISDDRIADQIIACHRMGRQIQIITDNEKLYDTGSDIKRLIQAGIPVKVDNTSNHMHHKFAIADRRAVLTGSYNWTRSAEQYNHENILVTSDQLAVQKFESEFERLWQKMEKF
jgi:phosphatidylserine/phosphatidylglycerophosphate/cardiolipin synthase-like enzyme